MKIKNLILFCLLGVFCFSGNVENNTIIKVSEVKNVDKNFLLDTLKADTALIFLEGYTYEKDDGSEFSFRLTGAKRGEIKEADIREGKVEYLQVMDVKPDSQAWNTGLRKDDIIYSINKQLVKTFEQAFAATKLSRSLLLNIQRGNQAMYILIK